MLKNVYERTGLNLIQLYGSTDFGLAMVDTVDTGQNTNERGMALVPGVEGDIEPIDSKKGVGFLKLLSPFTSEGYLDDDKANEETFNNGYYNTGDVAIKDNNGRFLILGRISDIIFTDSGYIIATSLEVELNKKIPGFNCIVFPKDKNEVLVAIESLNNYVDFNFITALGDFFKRKKLLLNYIVIDIFPRTPVGKIDKPRIFNIFKNKVL